MAMQTIHTKKEYHIDTLNYLDKLNMLQQNRSKLQALKLR